MTDTGTDVTRGDGPQADVTETEPGSRVQQYRKRIEEWAFALRDGAEQHAPPEMLSGLAGTARNVAQFFDGMAERARAKQAKEEAVPAPTDREPEAKETAKAAAEPEAEEQAPAPTEQGGGPSKD